MSKHWNEGMANSIMWEKEHKKDLGLVQSIRAERAFLMLQTKR